MYMQEHISMFVGIFFSTCLLWVNDWNFFPKKYCLCYLYLPVLAAPGSIHWIGTTWCKVRYERHAHAQCMSIPNAAHCNFLCLTMHR